MVGGTRVTQSPWRRPPREQFPGVPAWGAPTTRAAPEHFPRDALGPVDADWAWNGADGSGVRVCVVDTGVEGGHPLVGALERSVTVEADLSVRDCPPGDSVGHGTACAGIVRAVAPGASLSSVRVLTDGRTGTGAGLIAGLRWAIEEGFDVINLSLATTRREFARELSDLADLAYFRRSVLVVSAHNMPVVSYPWTFSAVVSVASHDEHDPSLFYYNPAPPVEFYARGVNVPVAWRGGGTIRTTGNSFAAPHITGLCARTLSKHRHLTPFQLKSVLYQVAHNVGDRP
ncbi:S8 family serine peptidase [Streptomyces hydrogenans]|uniref:S8 family serine peptidase n=1 Tax=Streptomyces hydrogenans TaxID=1873719 RepID=UPI00363E54E0